MYVKFSFRLHQQWPDNIIDICFFFLLFIVRFRQVSGGRLLGKKFVFLGRKSAESASASLKFRKQFEPCDSHKKIQTYHDILNENSQGENAKEQRHSSRD